MTVKCLMQRRVDPLSDVSCGVVLKLLVKFPITGETDPKLIIQVTNIIVRSSVSTPEGIMATYHGLQVLHQLTNQPGSSQVADLLLNNKPLLNKLTSFITMESIAGGRQCVAVSLELVGSLVERYQHSLSDCYTETITLCYDVLLRTLTSTNPHIIGAGLVLWRAVTSEKWKPSCLKIVHKIAGKEKESIRQLAFLLINIIAKEDELLTSKAIDVYINLHVNHPLDGSSHSWIKQLLQFLCWQHNQQELPMQYQPLINVA